MKIRKANIGDIKVISKIYVDTWKTTYNSLVPDNFLNELSYEEAENKWMKFFSNPLHKSFTYIASNDSEEIIGFAAARISSDKEFKGELYALYLLPAAQGLGTGRSLISTVAEHFKEEGISSMMVWVMKNNKAGRGFYKRLGGKYYTHRESQFGECLVEDEAYGWKDISMLSLNDRSK
ncbi:GNAT family N-acetyltransferase [Priestia megaterium]|uniref:GNAT family N-acetyltransferase n=1 Tax=Priestia megaterium TaxID=1404 RepID=UPI001BE89DA6|nr:GNAT family N-acetyltransferase [Priestia megaterium]MBT2255944.1 GNAT family N-acetyltransferase [Priestia megaterium]MBT2281229.1 GNAT family N-acetyltransferase [Priestia megaterium]